MRPTVPIPESLWNTIPPDAQAALMAVFESLRCRIAELEQRVADLEGRLKLNSTNVSDHGARSGNRSAGGLLG